MTIENNPPLGIYPPNIVNELEPEAEPELINAVVNTDNNIIVTYNYAIKTTDWIGIYTGDSDDLDNNFFYLWSYVGGTQTPSDTGNGVLILNESNSLNYNTIEFPLLAGEYKVAFFIDDSYDIYGDILYLTIESDPEPAPIENNIDNNPYQLTLTTYYPPKVHHGNGIRRSWTAGTFLIDGSHLNKARLCASRINNTIFGPIHGKPVFVKNNLNVYGRYAGFPGGSGAPIRNKF
jgi:hypothetical protein